MRPAKDFIMAIFFWQGLVYLESEKQSTSKFDLSAPISLDVKVANNLLAWLVITRRFIH